MSNNKHSLLIVSLGVLISISLIAYSVYATSIGSTITTSGLTVSGNTTTTNLVITTNSQLGTVSSGTWQGTPIADSYVTSSLTISGGTINNTPIGLTTASTGAFTTLEATGTSTLATTTISGRLGIGTDNPTQELEISGNILASGNLALSGASVDANRGVNYSSIDEGSDTYGLYNAMDTGNNNVYGIYNNLTEDYAAKSAYGLYNNITVNGNALWDPSYGYGVYNFLDVSPGSNHVNYVYGTYNILKTHKGEGPSGVAYGAYITDDSDSDGGYQYGLYVDLDNTNTYNYSIYVNSGSGISYFGSNVGIGTTAPKNKLDVEGGMVVGATYSGTNTAPSNGMLIEGKVGIGTSTPQTDLHIEKTASSTIRIGNTSKTGCLEMGGNNGTNLYYIYVDEGTGNIVATTTKPDICE